MKVKLLNPVKYSGKWSEAGKIIDVNQEAGAELIRGGFAVEHGKQETTPKTEETAAPKIEIGGGV